MQARIDLRIDGELKRAFAKAAKFRHQSLSQFVVQACLAAIGISVPARRKK